MNSCVLILVFWYIYHGLCPPVLKLFSYFNVYHNKWCAVYPMLYLLKQYLSIQRDMLMEVDIRVKVYTPKD